MANVSRENIGKAYVRGIDTSCQSCSGSHCQSFSSTGSSTPHGRAEGLVLNRVWRMLKLNGFISHGIAPVMFQLRDTGSSNFQLLCRPFQEKKLHPSESGVQLNGFGCCYSDC